jgi:hypothetical protein
MHAEWMGPVFTGNVHDDYSVELISVAATLGVSFAEIGCDDFFAFPVECLRDFLGNAAHGTGHDNTTHFFGITAHDKNTARTDFQVSAEKLSTRASTPAKSGSAGLFLTSGQRIKHARHCRHQAQP